MMAVVMGIDPYVDRFTSILKTYDNKTTNACSSCEPTYLRQFHLRNDDCQTLRWRSQARCGGIVMKRVLIFILVWSLLVLTGTLVSADGRTRSHKSAYQSIRITTEATDGIR